MDTNSERWRLVLGEFAEQQLPIGNEDRPYDETLAFLYQNEYSEKSGIRKMGGREESALTVPKWIHEVRELFPKETVEIMQKQALEKYGMYELLTDEKILEQMEPNMDLLRAVLTFKHMMPTSVKDTARKLIEEVVREIEKQLESDIRKSFYGRKKPYSSSPLKVYRNLDMKKTIMKNLKHYDPHTKRLGIDKVYFNHNIKSYNPWHIIMVVDQSGSMMDSVIYSAVMAGIFTKLPMLSTHLVAFDTEVVDLSHYLEDAVDVLMSVQLGGGTHIAKALSYSEKLITHPQKTIVILVSDLYEGYPYAYMYKRIQSLIEMGCKVCVLPALDYEAHGNYDKEAAKKIANLGAYVAAITPKELVGWIGQVIV